MVYVTLFLLGFGLSIIGFIYIITYLNYISIGYTLVDYMKMIFTKKECLLAFIGIFLMMMVILKKR